MSLTVPQEVFHRFNCDHGRAVGAAFTKFCAERGYVRDIFTFSPEQEAEWDVIESAMEDEYDARRAALCDLYEETSDTETVPEV